MSSCFVTCLNREILEWNCLCGSAKYTHKATTKNTRISLLPPNPPPTDGASLLLHSSPCSFLPAAPGWARTPQPLLLPFAVAAAIWLANTTPPPPPPPSPSPMRLAGVGSWRRISGWGVGISFPPPQTKRRLRRTAKGREGKAGNDTEILERWQVEKEEASLVVVGGRVLQVEDPLLVLVIFFLYY